MDDSTPELSVLLVVGRLRRRGQKSLDALLGQTAIDRLEIVVVDTADGPDLKVPAQAPVRYARRPDLDLWSEGRYAALQMARGPIVASIEDHAYAEPGWAAALLEAYRGPWAGVGYEFTNANPSTYWSRASFVNDYGPWMHPAEGGPTDFMPGHNVSYRSEVLDSFGGRLQALYALDFSIQEAIRQRGLPMCIAPGARVAHENFNRLSQILGVHIAYSRLFAGQRLRTGHWSWPRRFLYAALVPAGSPAVAALRYARSFGARRLWWPALQALPLFLLTRLLAGVSESVSYLAGSGTAERDVMHRWEMGEVRSTAD